jgi:hypothetical protein
MVRADGLDLMSAAEEIPRPEDPDGQGTILSSCGKTGRPAGAPSLIFLLRKLGKPTLGREQAREGLAAWPSRAGSGGLEAHDRLGVLLNPPLIPDMPPPLTGRKATRAKYWKAKERQAA